MKIKLITMLLMVVLLTGCATDSEKPKYFKAISREKCGVIVYDTRTGVEYWKSAGAHSEGILTPLTDAEGKPLIYNGSK